MTNQSEQAKGPIDKFEEILQGPEFFSINGMLKPEAILAMQKAYQLGQSQPGIKQWVSVDNEIPPEDMEVWAINKHGRMRQASWMQYTDQNKDWFEINFTHWQPLPDPPNSTTTPKSDMVSKEKVIELLERYLIQTLDIQECITKIKEI